MAGRRRGGALREIRTLFDVGTVAGLSDAELLERFAARSGEAAELAFAALVERHGPMVLRVCRKALGDPHDAQDAFQATFLVLVERAGSIRAGGSVGPWLHGVALRVSAGARSAAARRRRHERRRAEAAAEATSCASARPADWSAALHEEVDRLPARYRAAVVLCDLQGRSCPEAAGQLGWPVGTVKSRLARGRARLRTRLVRRGLAPSAGALTALTAGEAATAAVPTTLAATTARLAARAAAGEAATGTVAALTKGVIRAMILAKWKTAALAVALALVAAGGVVGQAPPRAGDDGDRLRSLEDKLDRVLRALEGGHRGWATTPNAAINPPANNMAQPGGPGGTAVTSAAPLQPSNVAADIKAELFRRGYATASSLHNGAPAAHGVSTPAPPDRLEQFERRLAEVERRLDRLEDSLKRVPTDLPAPRRD
jgi:RNA polymerase sigma factor (sigma-70 family)